MTVGVPAELKEKKRRCAVLLGACPDGQVLESCEPVRFRCCLDLNRMTKVMAARLYLAQNEINLGTLRKQAKTLAS
jgi:hypothetical protein